ncbi:MAG: hypothetical protein WCJ09_20880 [Planctomycetota bacterium]
MSRPMNQNRSEDASIQKPVLAIRSQANCCGLAALAFGMVCPAAIFLLQPDANLVVGILTGIAAATNLLIWGLLVWMSRSMMRDAAALMAGGWVARWVIPDAEWRDFVEYERRRFRWVIPGVAAFGTVIGGVIGYAIFDGGDRIGGEIWLTFAIPMVTGTLLCGLLGAFFHYINRLQFTMAAQNSGVVIFGAKGFYIPGLFRPWRSFGQRFDSAVVVDPRNGQLARLAMTFKVKSKNGTVDVLEYVPIPSRKEDDAIRVVNWLNQNHGQ